MLSKKNFIQLLVMKYPYYTEVIGHSRRMGWVNYIFLKVKTLFSVKIIIF